jgi:CheY-like chemotaxis protein
MRILFFDDNDFRHKRMKANSIGFNVTYVFNARDCIAALQKEEFDLLMLDHDMDRNKQGQILEDEEDGRFVTRWMATEGLQHKGASVIIHSLNPVGANQMKKILDDAGFSRVICLPLAWTMIEKDEDGGIVFDPNKSRSINDLT